MHKTELAAPVLIESPKTWPKFKEANTQVSSQHNNTVPLLLQPWFLTEAIGTH